MVVRVASPPSRIESFGPDVIVRTGIQQNACCSTWAHCFRRSGSPSVFDVLVPIAIIQETGDYKL